MRSRQQPNYYSSEDEAPAPPPAPSGRQVDLEFVASLVGDVAWSGAPANGAPSDTNASQLEQPRRWPRRDRDAATRAGRTGRRHASPEAQLEVRLYRQALLWV
jgi:hypothetical protein